MVPKGTLCALLLLVQVLALAACARATPTPLVPENVRQQVVGAMQRDGRLTKVDVRIVGPGNVGDAEGELQEVWLDLPGQQARVESRQAGRLQNVSVFVEGKRATYDPASNRIYELPVGLSPEMANDPPPVLNNPALMAVLPLGMSIVLGGWRPAGDGEWQGTHASIWEADYPGPELPMHTYTRVYIDPRNGLPLGEEMEFAQQEGGQREPGYSVSYDFTFVVPEALPERGFNIGALRDMQLSIGGDPGEARDLGYTVYWLGEQVDLGDGYPTLQLYRSYTHESDRLRGPHSRFSYRVYMKTPSDPAGIVDVTVWPKEYWESNLASVLGPEASWLEPDAVREPAMIGDVNGEMAVSVVRSGHPESLGLIGAGELLLWLPDTVVLITASPIAPDGTTPKTGAPSEGESPSDVNVFNSGEPLRLLMHRLEVLR